MRDGQQRIPISSHPNPLDELDRIGSADGASARRRTDKMGVDE